MLNDACAEPASVVTNTDKFSTCRLTSNPAYASSAAARSTDVVHTFTASHNKIAYKLKLSGTIARWPDVADEFEIEVAPEGGSR